MIDKGIDFESDDLSWMKMLGLDLDTNPMLSGLGQQVGRDFVSSNYTLFINTVLYIQDRCSYYQNMSKRVSG